MPTAARTAPGCRQFRVPSRRLISDNAHEARQSITGFVTEVRRLPGAPTRTRPGPLRATDPSARPHGRHADIDAIRVRRNQQTDMPNLGTAAGIPLAPRRCRTAVYRCCTRCHRCSQPPPGRCRSGNVTEGRTAEARQRPGRWRTSATHARHHLQARAGRLHHRSRGPARRRRLEPRANDRGRGGLQPIPALP